MDCHYARLGSDRSFSDNEPDREIGGGERETETVRIAGKEVRIKR
jgi:hypothetical protein